MPCEQASVATSLEEDTRFGHHGPQQHLVRLEDGPTHPRLQCLDRSSRPEAVAADKDHFRRIAKIMGYPFDDGTRLDTTRIVWDIRQFRCDDRESLAVKVGGTELIQLVLEPRWMDQRHPLDVQHPQSAYRRQTSRRNRKIHPVRESADHVCLGVKTDRIRRSCRRICDHLDRSRLERRVRTIQDLWCGQPCVWPG